MWALLNSFHTGIKNYANKDLTYIKCCGVTAIVVEYGINTMHEVYYGGNKCMLSSRTVMPGQLNNLSVNE